MKSGVKMYLIQAYTFHANVPLHTSWKHEKTTGIMMFSGGK